MNIKKIVSSFLIFSSCAIPLIAQDWKADLLAMNKAYLDAKSFQMNIEVTSYANKNDATPILTANGKVFNANGSSYSEMVGKTTLLNQKCMLVVDNKQKMIIYKKVNKKESSVANGFSLAQIDSAVLFFGKNVYVNYISNTPKEKRLLIKYKNGNIDKIEMTINPVNNTLTEMIYYYNMQAPGYSQSVEKTVIRFMNIQLNNSIPESLFSESKYVIIKKSKVTASANYAKYKIINQDETHIQ